MAAPGITRLHVWDPLEEVDNSQLNAEFDNLLNNLRPQGSDDYSTNLTQSRLQTSPATLATTLAGELERLRYQIAQITGQTYWDQVPLRSLSTESNQPALYFPFDGATADDVYSDTINRGALINLTQVATNTADLNSDDFSSATKKFGNYALALGAGNILAGPARFGQRYQGTLSAWFNNLSPGDYIAYNPQAGIELFVNGSGQLVARIIKATAATETSKATATITGTNTVSGSSTWKHVFMGYGINGYNGSANDVLRMNLDGVAEGTQLSAQTIAANVSDGGIWYFGAKRNDPAWTKYSAFSVTPSTEAVDAWTLTGTAGTVSGGVLTMSHSTTGSYSRTPVVNFANGFTMEAKARITSINAGGAGTSVIDGMTLMQAVDDTNGRSVKATITTMGITLEDHQTGASVTRSKVIYCDTRQWHVYRLVATTATNINFYIDGELRENFTLAATDAGTDLVRFGITGNADSVALSMEYEMFAYVLGSATAPLAVDAGGFLDDIMILRDYIASTATETSLAASKASSVVGRDFIPGLQLTKFMRRDHTGQAGGSTIATGVDVAVVANTECLVPSDGKTPISVELHLSFNAATDDGGIYLFIQPVSTTTSLTNLDNTVMAQYPGVVMRAFDDSSGVIPWTGVLPPGLHKFMLLGCSAGAFTSEFELPYLMWRVST